jgi:nucleoside-diphosphate-sugar epimerase
MNRRINSGILKSVIITGGSGFIGRHEVKRLLSNKQCAIALIADGSNLKNKELRETMKLTFYVADKEIVRLS